MVPKRGSPNTGPTGGRCKLLIALAIVLAFGAGVTMAQTYPEGMIAYWKFDDGSGIVAQDSVGGYDGDLYGPTWVDGRVGGALTFDGNDWVELPTEAGEFRVDMSWELWMKSTMAPAYKFVWFARLNEPGNPDLTCCYWSVLFVHFDAHYLHFVVAKPSVPGLPGNAYFSYLNTAAHYLDGEWHHLAVTKANTYIRFYVDGVRVAEDDNPELNGWDTFPTYHYVGRADTSGPAPWAFEGSLDELAIYDRALAPDEIQAHYENGLEGRGYEVTPTMTCVGFNPPMDSGPVTVRGKKRALPVKAELLNADGFPMTDLDLVAPPVIQVLYDSGTGGDPVDVTDEALSAGEGSDGNQFVFSEDQVWQFNLKTGNYTAAGQYIITMESGDDDEYTIDPTCEGVFVRN